MKKLKLSFFLFNLTLLFMTGCNDNKTNYLIKQTDKPSLKNTLDTSKSQTRPENIVLQPITIEKETLKAFESCHITDNLLSVREYLIKNSKPTQTSADYLSYKVKANFLNLPIKEIVFGTCLQSEPLLTDCSFVKDIALVLDIRFIDAKAQLLKENNDIDLSKELRADLNGPNDGPTLRPFMYAGPDNTTILHCDTGGL